MSVLEPGDFYMDDGKMVLTEQYHRRRGICCGNGCRHCPFDHEKVPPATRQTLTPPWMYFERESS